MSASFFGTGSQESFSDLILANKLAIVGVPTGAALGILQQIDQPYEILICVLLVLMLFMVIGNDIRTLAIALTDPRNKGWRKSVSSYVDYLRAAVIMFTTQYFVSLITSEWERVGYSRWDTIIVGIFLILMFIGFLVFYTISPFEEEEEATTTSSKGEKHEE